MIDFQCFCWNKECTHLFNQRILSSTMTMVIGMSFWINDLNYSIYIFFIVEFFVGKVTTPNFDPITKTISFKFLSKMYNAFIWKPRVDCGYT